MFSTLESSWDHSGRRGWSAVASFAFQAMAMSLLLAIPLFWVQGPPRLQWLRTINIPPVQSPAPPPQVTREHYAAGSVSNLLNGRVITPSYIPTITPRIGDNVLGPPAPDLANVRFGRSGPGDVAYSLGGSLPIVAPKPPAPTHPLKI